ncbi:MAG: hypothetical protein WBW92_04990, partial [Rhodanobacteraceae bacterium]
MTFGKWRNTASHSSAVRATSLPNCGTNVYHCRFTQDHETMSREREPMSYRAAGVDIDAGNELV